MNKTLPHSVLLGLTSALLFASPFFITAIGSFLSLISAAPLIAAGLRYGPGAAIMASMAGVLWLVMAVEVTIVAAYVVMDVLPALLVVGLALTAGPVPQAASGQAGGTQAQGSMIPLQTGRVLAGLGMGAFGLLLLIGSLVGDGDLRGVVRDAVAETEALLQQMLGEDLGGEPIPEVKIPMADWLPAMVLIMWISRALASAWLAVSIMGRRGLLNRPVPLFGELGDGTGSPPGKVVTLPNWYAGLFLGVCLAALIGPGNAGYLAANGAILLSVPLFVMGLAAVHVAVRDLPAKLPVLVGFYVLLFFGGGFGKAAVVFLGLVEVMLRRAGTKSGSNGSAPGDTGGNTP
ncbi:MAG: hypothetical protein ACPGOY_07595 [Rhodospirillaceae bacterium]